MSRPANPVTIPLADYSPQHFLLAVVDNVATVTLNRPEALNALTLEIYAQLRDLFAELEHDDSVKVVIITGTGRGFCSGGDVHKIIGEVLDHGGPDFALIQYGAMLKLWALGALLVGILLPVRTGWWLIDLLAGIGGMAALAVLVGIIESTMARLRLVRVAQFLVAASVLSILALVLVMR